LTFSRSASPQRTKTFSEQKNKKSKGRLASFIMTKLQQQHAKKKAAAPPPKSMQTKIALVFFGMLQICLAAGLIVGWAGIAGSMLGTEQGVTGAAAGLTLDQTTQLYGIAASVNYISPLGLGMLLDKYGPRVCSTMANTIVACGCLIFALATELSTFAVGVSLIAFGGPGVQTSLMHLGNLFPSRRFFVMVSVAGVTIAFVS
jgi:MFS family permease